MCFETGTLFNTVSVSTLGVLRSIFTDDLERTADLFAALRFRKSTAPSITPKWKKTDTTRSLLRSGHLAKLSDLEGK